MKINIPEVLLHLRGEVVRYKQQNSVLPGVEGLAMKLLAGVFASPAKFERMQKLGRFGQRLLLKRGVITSLPGQLGGWTAVRDVYPIANQTFREWWRERQRSQGPSTARPDASEGGKS